MRILLAHNSTYYPSLGGGDKSNRLLMEALAARGHEVRVFTRTERLDESSHERFLEDLDKRSQRYEVMENGEVRFELRGVDVRTLTRSPQLRRAFQAHIDSFDPDIIVTSTDDPGQLLFDLAVKAPGARVVYLVRATIAVPFGPDSSGVSEKKTETLRQADGVVGVSHYVAGYVRQWAGIDAIHVPISLLEPVAEYPNLGRFDNRFVSMVNPCAVKGISILLGLAEQMPDLQFAAIPSWGTLPEELDAMRRLPNITLLPHMDDIDGLFRDTRVTLVPSVWAEARSRVVLEAMSRGIPVLASDVGGLHEAKLGVPYLLPVQPIRHYKQTVDASMVPVAEVPPQDVRPWVAVLRRLTSDRAHWDEIASASRRAALDYAGSLTAEPFERVLEGLLERPKKGVLPGAKAQALSEDKRKLLALKLKQRAAARSAPCASAWFPGAERSGPEPLRLFCFPPAGSGAVTYTPWREDLRGIAMVCPVCPPGRETRAAERPLENMREMVEALAREIRPFLDRPFAFFGHSMGAGVAFELSLRLREEGLPAPRSLHVSGARSPVLRMERIASPDPTREELIAELRRLDGFPQDALADPAMLESLLPVLEADTRLYRRYVYAGGEPLSIPVHAYAGDADPNTAGGAVERWREVTTGQFTLDVFPGGHFYLNEARKDLLRKLSERLRQA